MKSSKRLVIGSLCSLLVGFGYAAPAAKSDVSVAAGFPVWQGVSDANHVAGRWLCPSDLRDKVVVVIEFDAAEAAKQLKACLGLTGRIRVDGIRSYYDFKMPTDQIVVCSNRGTRNDEKVLEAIKRNDAAAGMKVCGTPIYNGLTLEGGPAAEGGYPYFYVLGPGGGDPLFKGSVSAKNIAEAGKIIKTAMKDLPPWEPFVGRTPETKTAAEVRKAVAAGKPLVPLYKKLLSAIKSKDAAVAAEAQLSYDALERTRSDLAHRIVGESRKSPACAFRDYELLAKFWPTEKARVADAYKTMSSVKEGPTLGRYYTLLLEATQSPTSPAAQKALARELKKMPVELAHMKESSNVNVQNDAYYLSQLLENAGVLTGK